MRSESMNWSTIHQTIIYNRFILWLLLLCNLLGTIYGYIWYLPQLMRSEWYFWIFIPDSPTASLFLTISIFLMLFNKRNAIIDTLAFVTLIKYGFWAVIMNIFMFIHDDTVYIAGIMLIFSHAIMAIQAILFLPRLTVTALSLTITLIWIFHNDVIDYVFHQYPVYGSLIHYESIIGYIAFWLSAIPFIVILYIFRIREDKKFDHY